MTVMDRIRGRTPAGDEHHEERHVEGRPVADRDTVVSHQHERFGGLNWGAAFFGWLVAVGLTVLLTALLSAAGAAVAISELETTGQAVSNADTIGLAGGIALLVIALIA